MMLCYFDIIQVWLVLCPPTRSPRVSHPPCSQRFMVTTDTLYLNTVLLLTSTFCVLDKQNCFNVWMKLGQMVAIDLYNHIQFLDEVAA